MPTPRSDADNAELHEALHQLRQQVEVLTDAADRLCDELQWRKNNERRNGADRSLPPVVVHSMPADPRTDDWQINRGRPETQSKQVEAVKSQYERAVDQLTRELAELRQYVAAIMLLGEFGDDPELQESYASLFEWASQEFDPEILREAIPDKIIAGMAQALRAEATPSMPRPTSESERQRQLFTKEASDRPP